MGKSIKINEQQYLTTTISCLWSGRTFQAKLHINNRLALDEYQQTAIKMKLLDFQRMTRPPAVAQEPFTTQSASDMTICSSAEPTAVDVILKYTMDRMSNLHQDVPMETTTNEPGMDSKYLNKYGIRPISR